MPTLPPVPPIEQRQPTLTDLAAGNAALSKELAGHTNARGFLFRALTGEIELPCLYVRPPLGSNPTADDREGADIDMRALPQEIIETILGVMLEHEERLACETWQQLSVNSALACKIIEQLKARALAEQQKREQEESFPPTIPMPRRDKEPADDQPSNPA